MKRMHLRWAIFLILTQLLSAACSAKKTTSPPSGGQNTYLTAKVTAPDSLLDCPALVLFEVTGGWTGNSKVEIVLYEDGSAIYWSEKAGRYETVRLSEDEVTEVFSQLETNRLPNTKPLTRNYVRIGSHVTLTRVSFRSPTTRVCRPDAEELLDPHAINYLRGFEHTAASEWIPERVLIYLTPLPRNGYWKELPWPADWPRIDSAAKLKNEERYLLSVPRAQYEKMRAALEGRPPGHLPLYNGKFWFLEIAYPLPHEKIQP